MALTAPGQFLATAAEDGLVQLSCPSGARVSALPLASSKGGSAAPLCAVQFSSGTLASASGSQSLSCFVAAGGESGIVGVWETQSGQQAHSLRSSGAVYALTFYGNDSHLASAGQGTSVVLHSLLSGSETGRLACASPVRGLHSSPFRANMLAGACDDGAVVVWDATARAVSQTVGKAHNAPISAVLFSPTSKAQIATASLDRTAVLFDLAARRVTHTVRHDGGALHSVAYSCDGMHIALGAAAGRTLLFDLRALRTPLRSFVAHKSGEAVRALQFVATTATSTVVTRITAPTQAQQALPQTPVASSTRTKLNAIDVMEVFSPVADAAPVPSSAVRPSARPLLSSLVPSSSISSSTSSASVTSSLAPLSNLPSSLARATYVATSALSVPRPPVSVTAYTASPLMTSNLSTPVAPAPIIAATPKTYSSSSLRHIADANAANANASASASANNTTVGTPKKGFASVTPVLQSAQVSLHTTSSPHDSILSPLAPPASTTSSALLVRGTPAQHHSITEHTPSLSSTHSHSLILSNPPAATSPLPTPNTIANIAKVVHHPVHSSTNASPLPSMLSASSMTCTRDEAPANSRHVSDEVVERLRGELRGDIRAMHLDMLRQFHAHQSDTATLISAALSPLLDEIARLRAENVDLRKRCLDA